MAVFLHTGKNMNETKKPEKKKKDTPNNSSSPEKKAYNLDNFSDQLDMFRDKLDEETLKELISQHITKLIDRADFSDYRVVFLIDKHNSISGFHSDKIYKAIPDPSKNVLMIIESGGGEIEPAYLISKTCKRLSKEKFVVSIPRRAKSAATLISLGAKEIHMGLLSELGPIDPQFGGFPALGLSNAVEKIAAMTEKYPKSSDMFAKYLNDNLSIRALGYYERVNESATQYAARLLSNKKLPNGKKPDDLADHFTNHYKDHSFVIDSDEATTLLGEDTIKENTKEYLLGNEIYEFLHLIEILFDIFKDKKIRYVGSPSSGLEVIDKPKSK